ncbi:hypothetical protein [Sulfurimonas sp.]|uniref:hypothetical protein n=1 Tax=Sulfurimonas sp. TaxID=2022749 RepID=UPI0025CF16A9|nr:hypothetical protein [Sulfurimonas sp.]MBW6488440.1 hypothetical protein [Sulfurimonas sp.]
MNDLKFRDIKNYEIKINECNEMIKHYIKMILMIEIEEREERKQKREKYKNNI